MFFLSEVFASEFQVANTFLFDVIVECFLCLDWGLPQAWRAGQALVMVPSCLLLLCLPRLFYNMPFLIRECSTCLQSLTGSGGGYGSRRLFIGCVISVFLILQSEDSACHWIIIALKI